MEDETLFILYRILYLRSLNGRGLRFWGLLVHGRENFGELVLAEGNFNRRAELFSLDSSVGCYFLDIGLNAQVLLWVSFLSQEFSSLGGFINPPEFIWLDYIAVKQSRVELGNWTHLSVEEGVPKQ